MRKTSAAILSLVLSSLLPTAYGQFGGGYAPPQPPSPPPTETPAVPVPPTVPAQTAPVNPTEEGILVAKGEMLIKLNDSVIAAEVARARKQSTQTFFFIIVIRPSLPNH